MLSGILALSILAAPPVVVPNVAVVSPTHVLVTLDDGEPSQRQDDWSIRSEDDPAYARSAYPVRLFRKSKPRVAMAADGGAAFAEEPEFEVLLELPTPLQAGF